MPQAPETFLTPSSAAAFLGVTRKTIYNWISGRRITAYRLGKAGAPVRIARSDLESMLTKKEALR